VDPLTEEAHRTAKELTALRRHAMGDKRPVTSLSIEMCELLVGFVCQLEIEPDRSSFVRDQDLVTVTGSVPRAVIKGFIEICALLGAGVHVDADGTTTLVEASQTVDSDTVSFAQRLAGVYEKLVSEPISEDDMAKVKAVMMATQNSFDQVGLEVDLKSVTAVMLGATLQDVAERTDLPGTLAGSDPAPHDLVTMACAVLAAALLGEDVGDILDT
jgi:hypothetical protein